MNNFTDRIKKAHDLFLQGYNCSQSVFAAYSDMYGLDTDMALRISSSFGGGIGRMRETCGAACGMFMLAGLQTGSSKVNDRSGKGNNYAIVQKLAEEFRKEVGALKCADILRLRSNTPISSIPQERTAEYYKQRPCLRNVEIAAEIWGRYLESIGY